MSSKNTVRVLDPPLGCRPWTSSRNAKKYITQGRAVDAGLVRGYAAIRFHAADHRHISATTKRRPTLSDGDGFATLDQIRGLPVVVDAIRLMLGPRAIPPREPRPTQVLSITPQIDSCSFEDRCPWEYSPRSLGT